MIGICIVFILLILVESVWAMWYKRTMMLYKKGDKDEND